MKIMTQIAVLLLSLLSANFAFAAKGLYADINFGGEAGTIQANGNSELLISQKDGTQNGIWKIDGKVYVGFKQPGNAWSVFDPAGMGRGFTPPPQPETKVTIEKTNQEVIVAKRKGVRYNVSSEEGGKVDKGYMIASKDKDVKAFNKEFFSLIDAMQKSSRGGEAGPGSGMDSIWQELKKRDIGVLEFGDDQGNSSFKLTSLDRRDVNIKLPAEPGDPFANIGGPGIGDLGMGGSGPNGAPTEADIERMRKEMMESFQQGQIDQANARKQAEKEWHEKEARKQAEKAKQDSVEVSAEAAADEGAIAQDMAGGGSVNTSNDDADVTNKQNGLPAGEMGKKIGDLLKGWGN